MRRAADETCRPRPAGFVGLRANVALAFSYQNGRNEETAKRTDLYKLSLNFKTCAAFAGFSGGRCTADKD
ncbi:hypothetical protein [Bradyrhizobium sp. SZCCHNRI3043]|uniref:hypothetical protein n=1 Tax=Bradyrhizobium sp. SZCCHNRI3043 TaxID=3057292 RepID=UPI0028E6D697|nr:hypothetical protein [Bradyrhizobium sp. SZCCHNRI3043]